jgi:hypothetical protein
MSAPRAQPEREQPIVAKERTVAPPPAAKPRAATPPPPLVAKPRVATPPPPLVAKPRVAAPPLVAARAEAAEELDDFPSDDLIATPDEALPPPPGAAGAGPARPPMRPLKESWVAVAIDELRSNRLVQLGIAVVIGLLSVWTFWPRETPTLPISRIHAEPHRYDGRTVRLRGRVGDVFQVGAGYAFYLLQGSDTIVVFTRSRVPKKRENLSVSGSVSMGYLDGIARPALFEEAE